MTAASAAALARLSLNQRTIDIWSLRDVVNGCLQAGIPAIGIWHESLHEYGLDNARTLLTKARLRVSSLCYGGFLTAIHQVERRRALRENRAAIDEAAALGTDTLVIAVGGLPAGSRDLPGARSQVTEAIAELAPYAARHGVRLALEPVHPLFTADHGVLSTLGQALDLAEQFPPEQVAVVIDTFHVWWDPQIEQQISRAAGRIAAFQVCDWITPPTADTPPARGMMGDGHIDFTHLRRAVEAAGYAGDIEVEISNPGLWAADPHSVLRQLKHRYLSQVWGRDVPATT